MDFLSDFKFTGGMAATKKVEIVSLVMVIIVFILLIVLITGIRGNMKESLQNIILFASLALLGGVGLINGGMMLMSSNSSS
jgi:hypothetical protein